MGRLELLMWADVLAGLWPEGAVHFGTYASNEIKLDGNGDDLMQVCVI